jgi:hypothetical protein
VNKPVLHHRSCLTVDPKVGIHRAHPGAIATNNIDIVITVAPFGTFFHTVNNVADIGILLYMIGNRRAVCIVEAPPPSSRCDLSSEGWVQHGYARDELAFVRDG